jgi:hypothetical protein
MYLLPGALRWTDNEPVNLEHNPSIPVAPGDPLLSQHDDVITPPDILTFERSNILRCLIEEQDGLTSNTSSAPKSDSRSIF